VTATKGQIIGDICELRKELEDIDKMVNVCDTPCVNFGRAYRLLDDIKGDLGRLKTLRPESDEDDEPGECDEEVEL